MQKVSNISRHLLVAGFCKTKPTRSNVFRQMIREWVLKFECAASALCKVPEIVGRTRKANPKSVTGANGLTRSACDRNLRNGANQYSCLRQDDMRRRCQEPSVDASTHDMPGQQL
jgi:hypothetical protein